MCSDCPAVRYGRSQGCSVIVGPIAFVSAVLFSLVFVAACCLVLRSVEGEIRSKAKKLRRGGRIAVKGCAAQAQLRHVWVCPTLVLISLNDSLYCPLKETPLNSGYLGELVVCWKSQSLANFLKLALSHWGPLSDTILMGMLSSPNSCLGCLMAVQLLALPVGRLTKGILE